MTTKELYDAIGGNYEVAFERLMSEKFISKYIVKFLRDHSYSDLMEEWNGNKDSEELFKKSHSLKGVCANLALDKLFDTVCVITDHFRAGEDNCVNNIEEYFEKLEVDYKASVALIEEFAVEHPIQ